MKILKYKKLSRNRYKVTFDGSELILYEDVILKNNLLREREISLNLLELIIEENKYYEIYDTALNYIETRERSVNEIRKYLNKKNYDTSFIEDVINRLQSEGQINEERYVSAYINDKINLSKTGPYKIKKELLDLGIEESLIDTYLNNIEKSLWTERIEKIIEKKLKTMKNKSEYIIKNKLREDLYNLGYDSDEIEYAISSVEKNDVEALKKDYEKANIKYSKKYTGTTLKTQIKSYLYRKGYNTDDINSIVGD